MKRFRAAPLDKMSVIISTGVTLLILSIFGSAFFIGEDTTEETGWYPMIIPFVILAIAYGLKPSAYVLSGGKLLVKRLGWSDAEFRISDISSVQKINKVPRKGLIRTLGGGGLFGYYGYFSNQAFGEMLWYLTRREDVLMLQIKSEKVLISPKDPDAFLSELESGKTLASA